MTAELPGLLPFRWEANDGPITPRRPEDDVEFGAAGAVDTPHKGKNKPDSQEDANANAANAHSECSTGPRVTLALSSTPLRLREPLAGLALRVADDARARDRPTCLLPRRKGERALSADRLRERIAATDLDDNDFCVSPRPAACRAGL